jgi:putative ATP-grasp target RiPP
MPMPHRGQQRSAGAVLILDRRAAGRQHAAPSALPAHRFDPTRQLNVVPDGRALVDVVDYYGYTSTQVGAYLRTDD